MIIIDNSVYEIYTENNTEKAKLIKFDIGIYNNTKEVKIENIALKDNNGNSHTYRIGKIGDYAFANCINLQEIDLNSDITEIGKGAFQNCINLKCICIPEKIEKISSHSFYNCKRLKEVSLKNHPPIKVIAKSAFENCTSLKKIMYGAEDKVYIPKTVRKIGKRAFANCQKIKEIHFLYDSPNDKMNISEEAFINCKKIKNIIGFERVDTVNKSVFENCTGLKEIQTKHIKKLKDDSFRNCQRLRKKGIDLSSVDSFAQSAFSDCNNYPFRNTLYPPTTNLNYSFPKSFTNETLESITYRALWSTRDLEQKNTLTSTIFLCLISITSLLMLPTFFFSSYIRYSNIIISVLLIILGIGIFVFDALSVNYKTTYAKLLSFYKALGISFFSAGLLVLFNSISSIRNSNIHIALVIAAFFLYCISIIMMIFAGVRTIVILFKHNMLIKKLKQISLLTVILSFVSTLIYISDAKQSIKEFGHFLSSIFKRVMEMID